MNTKTIEVTVQQVESNKSGRAVANQFRIYTNDGVYFQSYRTLIAFRSNDGTIILDADSWDYSRTTLKYLHQFLHTASKKEVEKAIKGGVYKLANLN